ncbi:MAG TPA: hypothetical protein VD741_08930 [Solirubrobacterales bacterium]|nr:hypothetical protein [Solirubrobacterales bacterium]
MSRSRSVLALAIAAVLTLAAVAVAKPTPVATTTTFKAIFDESSARNELSGQLKSPKAACKANRRFIVTMPSPMPPGFKPVTAGKGDAAGKWSAEVPGAVLPAGSRMTVIFKTTRVGNLLCKEAKKTVASATPAA